MAGNSKRQGAVRKSGSKKGATVGSGGQRRKGLEPKGPTPKATERVGHPASRRANAAARAPGKQHSAPDVDLVVGRNPVAEALSAGIPAVELLVVERVDADERVTAAIAKAHDRGVPVKERPKRDLDRLAGEANHQGLVLRTEPFAYVEPEDLFGSGGSSAGAASPAVIVALDGVTDPHNLGAIARSAAAFGSAGLLLPSRRSAQVTPTAWRSSAGALARLPVARATNLTRALADAAAAGYFVLALDGEGTRTITEAAAHFSDVPLLLVVGSEGAGVSRLIAQRADERVRIDYPGSVESLNASVAAGIALFAIASARAGQ